MRICVSIIILVATVLSAGCQVGPGDVEPPLEINSSPISEPDPPATGEPQMSPSIPADSGLQNLIDKAIADLANRLAIPAAQITLLEATPMVWSDASLGCPQPGMAYAQVPVDGLLIRLQAGNQTYEYHSGGIRDPFLCVQTVKDPNPPPQIDFFNLTPSDPDSPPEVPTPDNDIPSGENE